MDENAAKRLLETAVEDRDRTRDAAEQARERLYSVIRDVSPLLRQVDIVRVTGWTREHIRRITGGP
jgi:hypothetical protein